jgi:hypothetical protein
MLLSPKFAEMADWVLTRLKIKYGNTNKDIINLAVPVSVIKKFKGLIPDLKRDFKNV